MSANDFIKKLSSKELQWIFNKSQAKVMMMEFNGQTFVDEKK